MNSTSCIVNSHIPVWSVLVLVSFASVWPQLVSRGATYYVDGNSPLAFDSNPGTEAQPWKSISKATALLQPGDTLLIKAGTYRETVILTKSGTAANPITIMAYPGHEGKAIINAAEPLANWHKCAAPSDCGRNSQWSHIYYADVAGLVTLHPDKGFAVRQVFQHGQLLPRSRYPNTGWRYPTTIVNPKTTFSDSTLAKPRAYFNGAVCHIKTAVWHLDQIPIASSFGPTITLAANPRYDMSTRFGYYITSIVGEINEEGEWAYDPALKRLYLWPKGDVPEDLEFTYREYCVRTYDRVSFNIVRGLTMRNPYQYGIWLYLANNMTIENNTVEHAYTFGIYTQSTDGSCNHNQILHNTVKYSAFRGIVVDGGSSHCNVEGNYVYATGVEHFGEDLMHGPSHGVYVSGPFTRVYNNRINRTGYTSLYLDGKTLGRDISFNYITNTGLALSDGGGIYTGGFSDVPEKDHIHHNIIEDAIGCLSMDRNRDTGSPPTVETHSGDTPGIYVDEEGNNRIIEYNTVIGSRMAGIFLHWAPSNLVQKNTLYGNRVTQVYLSGNNRPRKMLVDDALLENILFATEKQQKTLYLAINYGDVRFGSSERNCFYHPFSDKHVYVTRRRSIGGLSREALTLKEWHALSGYDDNSTEFSSLDRLADTTIHDPVKSRIIYNASLEPTTIDLGPDEYCDVRGNKVQGQVTLAPFESKILIAADYDIRGAALP
jgi:parallel beta-helix repeat protein